jgi:NDP-sugar pyrophosphorylase family protein
VVQRLKKKSTFANPSRSDHVDNLPMKAMILAAGIGTRLRPITLEKPKCLVEVQGVSLLEHTILYLKFFGVNEIVINVHHFADQIEQFIQDKNSFGIQIDLSDEREALLDTGGGLVKAKWFFDDKKPFFLIASDVITNLDLTSLYKYHQQHDPLVTLAVKHRPSSREFLFDAGHRLCGWHNNVTGETRWVKEIPDPLKIAFSTIHVINPRIFNLVTETGAFSLIDLYLRLAVRNTILGFEHNETAWYEFGRIENLEGLNQSEEIKAIFRRFHI